MCLCLYECEKMKYKMQIQKGQKDPQINPKKPIMVAHRVRSRGENLAPQIYIFTHDLSRWCFHTVFY